MKKTLKLIARILIGLLAVVGVLVLVVGLMFDGFRDYVHGRIQRIAEQPYDDVDRIEIYLLQAPKGAEAVGTFAVRGGERNFKVYGTAALEGEEAEEAAELWSYTLKASQLQSLCHSPPYGVRMYCGKELRFETSICWACSNFDVTQLPGFAAYYGFAADSKSSRELLALFDSKLPYPKHETEGGGEDEPGE